MKNNFAHFLAIPMALVCGFAGRGMTQTAKTSMECTSTCCHSTTSTKKTSNLTAMETTLKQKTTPISVSCKLTSPQLQKRKQTVIASLQKQVLEKKELSNGYAYRFEATDNVLDELATFIKTERQCCDFFNFNLSIQKEGWAWLELTGPDGAKGFIDAEIELSPIKSDAK